jgi:hypothetical protein
MRAGLAVLLASACLGALAGCGSKSQVSQRELELERAEFVQVGQELRELQAPVAREVRASRGVWPSIYDGLPSRMSGSLRSGVRAASALAGSLPSPRFMQSTATLTGPASGVASLYEDFDRLAERGWRLTETAVEAIAEGRPAVARFVRANSPLYIDAIYDGHFYLSAVGKRLLVGYEKLIKRGEHEDGTGARAFAARLTPGEVASLDRFYSKQGVLLEPHPGPATEER